MKLKIKSGAWCYVGLLYEMINNFQIMNKKLFEFELFIQKTRNLMKDFHA